MARLGPAHHRAGGPLASRAPRDWTPIGAHATQAGAAQAVLAHLFPRDAASFAAWAEELAASRLWTGSHFRSACDAGLALGRAVGRRAIERALADGAR